MLSVHVNHAELATIIVALHEFRDAGHAEKRGIETKFAPGKFESLGADEISNLADRLKTVALGDLSRGGRF